MEYSGGWNKTESRKIFASTAYGNCVLPYEHPFTEGSFYLENFQGH